MHEQMDDVVGRSLLGIGGLSEAFIDELIARIARRDYTTPQDALREARQAIEQFEPMLADHLSDSVLAGWITGYDNVAAQFPPWLWQEFTDTIRRNPPGDPPQIDFFSSFDREPQLRLLNTEAAAKRLIERNILTREQFDAASEDARRQAFTIAGDLGDDTIERMRYFLYQDIAEGVSLTGFVNRIKENLGSSPIAPGHLETVYRTNLQAAFRDGRETLRANPIVAATFPYQEYIPIHDGRTRSTHRAMGRLGLNRTGIYRVDDPVWDRWTPPAGFNCRCSVRLLTLDQAAAAGVVEAQEWIETGRAPMQPEYRNALIDINPDPGFGHRGNVGAIVMSVVRVKEARGTA